MLARQFLGERGEISTLAGRGRGQVSRYLTEFLCLYFLNSFLWSARRELPGRAAGDRSEGINLTDFLVRIF